ncbi:MAG: hypothetical protein GEV06_08385 [Luteitalea sp.]|nr:hypothetical protein [Luteitalea sp.]
MRLLYPSRVKPRSVQLLVTCLIDHFFPQTGLAAVEVLERHGVSVTCPAGQTCCGQPAFNAGSWNDARAMARHTLDVLSKDERPIVVPSGSCADMVLHHYETLLAAEPAYAKKAHDVASRTYEFSQFLVDVLGITDTGATGTGRVTYHAACHGLRGLGVDRQPRALLEHVRGIERCPLRDADVCCGFGGLFAVKMADISGAMLAAKLDAIEESRADTVVVTDVSCGMHVQGGLERRGSRVRVRHLAEVLASR